MDSSMRRLLISKGLIEKRVAKYRNIPTIIDGIRFMSKREGRYYEALKLYQKRGELRFFLMQVPLRLPGGVRFVIDFVEFWANGDIKFVDVKGFKTQVYKIKKKQVEALYPIKIEEV